LACASLVRSHRLPLEGEVGNALVAGRGAARAFE
jgi:hypothetical protein